MISACSHHMMPHTTDSNPLHLDLIHVVPALNPLRVSPIFKNGIYLSFSISNQISCKGTLTFFL